MISEIELVDAIASLDAATLQRWIDQGFVLPQLDDESARFDSADVARVHLICELHYELHIEEDSLPVVLSLLDQLYATRRSLGTLLAAVEAEPEDSRARIAAFVDHRR